MRKTMFFASKNTPMEMFFSFLCASMASVAYVECGACSTQGVAANYAPKELQENLQISPHVAEKLPTKPLVYVCDLLLQTPKEAQPK